MTTGDHRIVYVTNDAFEFVGEEPKDGEVWEAIRLGGPRDGDRFGFVRVHHVGTDGVWCEVVPEPEQ